MLSAEAREARRGDSNTHTVGRLGAATLVLTAAITRGAISLEVGPRGSIYFGDFGAIYKLVFS